MNRTAVARTFRGLPPEPASGAVRVFRRAIAQTAPQLAVDAAGRLLVAWQQPGPVGFSRVLARRFSPAAAALGPPFLVRIDLITFSGQARLAGAPDGHFAAAWEESSGTAGEVFAALFELAGAPRRGLRIPVFEGPHLGVGRPDVATCVRRGAVFLCDTAHDGGAAEAVLPFGTAAQVPLLGDLDGDGRDDPCVRSGAAFLCDTAHDGGTAEVRLPFGLASDLPLLGDVDGDDDPCVVRGGAGPVRCDASHDGVEDTALPLHLLPGDVPLLGDATGDGRDEACVRRDRDLLCGSSLSPYNREPLKRADVPLLGDIDGF